MSEPIRVGPSDDDLYGRKKVTDLLPCPFCGGSASMTHGGFGERFVCCDDKNCGGRLGMGVWSASEENAAEWWNRRAHLATETAAIQKVRDEMAVIRMKFPGWEPESLKVQPAMVPVGKLHDWLAALDEILGRRE